MEEALTDYPDAPDIESSSEDYARRFQGPVGQWFLDVQAGGTERLLEAAGVAGRPLRALDVGGGHGQNVALMMRLGHHLTVQGSTSGCSRLLAHRLGDRVSFVAGPMTALPFEPKSFDVVLCYRIFAHIDDWQALAAELCRVARGLVIVDYASRRSVNVLSELFHGTKKQIESNTRRYRLQSQQEVTGCFRRHGFRPLASYPQYLFPMVLHRALGVRGASRWLEGGARLLGLTGLFGSPVLHGFVPGVD